MAVCETTHWILDCGEGHGCGLAEFSDTGELAGWFCQSELMKGRRRPRENGSPYLDRSVTLEFCCHDMSQVNLAEVLTTSSTQSSWCRRTIDERVSYVPPNT